MHRHDQRSFQELSARFKEIKVPVRADELLLRFSVESLGVTRFILNNPNRFLSVTLGICIFLKTAPGFVATRGHFFSCVWIYFKSLRTHKKTFQQFILFHFQSLWFPKMYCSRACSANKKHWLPVSNFEFLSKTSLVYGNAN